MSLLKKEMYLLGRTAILECQALGGLNNNSVFLSVLETRSPKCQHIWLLLWPLLACVAVSSHGLSSVCVCVCPNLLFSQGQWSYWIRAHIGPHFVLITSLKTLSPNTVTL